MDSSTGRPASSEGRSVLPLCGVLLGAPLVWLALLQTNYVMAYPACRDRSNWWLHAPGAVALLASVAIMWVAWRSKGRAAAGGTARLLAEASVMTAVLFLLVIGATLLPPLVLHPCD